MKNKIVSSVVVLFSIFFLAFLLKITKDFSQANSRILKSKNVIDVTGLITTKLIISHENIEENSSWTQFNFNDDTWLKIEIPKFNIIKLDEYHEGFYAYYRIKIPQKTFKNLSHLKDETFFCPQSVYFSEFQVFLNGKFYRTYKPRNPGEHRIVLPVEEGVDNIIAIKARISSGDTGINSRNKIMLGKGVEFNEVFSANFKGQKVFQLVFILCKSSILFIFALIYLLLRVDRSFDKFFIFGLCAVLEELIAGDYFYGPLNLNQMVFFYNFVNVGAAISAFLFFGQLTNTAYKNKFIFLAGITLTFISSLLAFDSLHWNFVMNLPLFMKSWNLFTVCILIFYVPKVFKYDKVLFIGLLIAIVLYIWGALFSDNIGLNLKAYGNLLIFFMVAYQTFALFRRDQEQLKLNEKQILEQEKDVAIGKTASLLAHDIRKPLDQMKLIIEKVASGEINREFLEIAKKDIDISIASVDQQVSDILNYSKSSDLRLAEISFYKLLAHSVKQIMSIHQEMNIVLEYEFNAHSTILGDQSRLSGALVNLLANAVEAVRDLGGRFEGKIKLSTFMDDNFFYFKIFNDGPEIPEKIIGDIFKPLFTFGKPHGTGLGLASVTKTVNEHNGNIDIKNIQGEGVEFTLRFQKGSEFDQWKSHDFKSFSKLYSYNLGINNFSESNDTCRIFVLEDNNSLISKIKNILSKLPFDYSVDVANNFSEAEELIKKKRYDFYLMRDLLGGHKIKEKYLSFLSSEVISYFDSVPENIVETCRIIFMQRPRILFVDDTKLFRVAWLMYHGEHNVKCVSSPEEALTLIAQKNENFDIYVVDFHFSNSSMNGLALALKIRELKLGSLILISSSLQEKSLEFKSISKNDYEVRKFLV